MKKKILAVAIVGILLLTGCGIHLEIKLNGNNNKSNETIENEINERLNKRSDSKEIEFIDGIYGMYGEDDGAMFRDYIAVYKGKDDQHIDISAYFYRTASFYMSDLTITRNKNGELIATKGIDPFEDESVWDYMIKEYQNLDDEKIEKEYQYLGDAKVDVIITDNKLKLKFNKDMESFNNVIEKEKIDLKCITEAVKQKALNDILDSDFENINKDIFEVIHDTKNYLVVRVKSYICNEHRYTYYNIDGSDKKESVYYSYDIEGSESIGMYKYYNIDKKNKKIVELDDITKRLDDLNVYIENSIDEKKKNWLSVETYWKVWPYENHEFKGIGDPEYFENYFEINEDNNTVKIRCLGYPDEANRAMGDLCIDVPFRFFDLNQ